MIPVRADESRVARIRTVPERDALPRQVAGQECDRLGGVRPAGVSATKGGEPIAIAQVEEPTLELLGGLHQRIDVQRRGPVADHPGLLLEPGVRPCPLVVPVAHRPDCGRKRRDQREHELRGAQREVPAIFVGHPNHLPCCCCCCCCCRPTAVRTFRRYGYRVEVLRSYLPRHRIHPAGQWLRPALPTHGRGPALPVAGSAAGACAPRSADEARSVRRGRGVARRRRRGDGAVDASRRRGAGGHPRGLAPRGARAPRARRRRAKRQDVSAAPGAGRPGHARWRSW
jgi:hypothetical protein